MFDVLTIGTATRDVFLTSQALKVLRDPKHLASLGFKTGEAECFALGAKLDIGSPVFATGGGAANAATTFARQGFRTAALIRLGADGLSGDVVADLRRNRVVPIAVVDKQLGTAYATVLLAPGGERTVLVYRGASEGFTPREIPWRKLTARWAYIAPSHTSPPLMRDILLKLKERKVKVAMNPSRYYLDAHRERLRGLLRYLDVVIVNREEASDLTGVPYGRERDIFKKFDALVPGIAVVTDGPRGARVSDGKYLYSAGVYRERRLADRTGAGDAFGSGFVAGLMQRNDIHHALRVAAANATAVVECIGAQAGVLKRRDLGERRWKYLDLDIEPL